MKSWHRQEELPLRSVPMRSGITPRHSLNGVTQSA